MPQTRARGSVRDASPRLRHSPSLCLKLVSDFELRASDFLRSVHATAAAARTPHVYSLGLAFAFIFAARAFIASSCLGYRPATISSAVLVMASVIGVICLG